MNVGDPVTPPPTAIQFPALLGEAFPFVGYPVEMVLAEKIVTMLDREELNTRERDFADVLLLIGQQSIDADRGNGRARQRTRGNRWCVGQREVDAGRERR